MEKNVDVIANESVTFIVVQYLTSRWPFSQILITKIVHKSNLDFDVMHLRYRAAACIYSQSSLSEHETAAKKLDLHFPIY